MKDTTHAAAAVRNLSHPLAYAQETLFSAFERNPGSRTASSCLALRIQGTVDEKLARTAFDRIVERHPMLRTVYARNGAELSQREVENAACDFRALDLSQKEATTRDARVREETEQPFDLIRGPVFRVRLFSFGEGCSVLLLCAHAIAVDNASWHILLREFTLYYEAMAENLPPRPAPLEATYYQCALHQRQLVNEESGGASLEFWRSRLPAEEATLELPLDKPRPIRSADDVAQLGFTVPRDLAERLSGLATIWGKTPVPVYLAAYAVLLSRYGNAEKVPIGLMATGRNTEDAATIVGNFSNLVLLTANCSPHLTFQQLTGQISMKRQGALEHGHVPLEPLLEKLAAQPPDGRAPLCDVYFLSEEGGDGGSLAGMPFETTTEANPVAGAFDLGMKVRANPGEVEVSLIYRADLFRAATIERMSRHFLRLLESIAVDPETSIASLEMMPYEESALVLETYAGETAEFPQVCLHELFAQQAALRPGAEALVFDGRRITYGELDRRSNRVANVLRGQGLRAGEPVGIFMKSSLDMIVAIVGVLKAGGAYAPIDPTYPAERIEFMVRDMAARWIMTHRAAYENLPMTAKLIYVDDTAPAMLAAGEEPVSNISAPESPAALIYTSGSTGQPKGAMIPHRGIVRGIRNANYLTVTAKDRVAQAMSPSFDVCMIEIWSALANGATLVGMPREVLLGPAAMARTLVSERVSVLFLSTAYVNQIGREAPDTLKTVRAVMFGGEAAEPGPIRNILKHGPPECLANCYGPTEAVVTATWHRIVSVPDDARSIPIGRPATNVKMYLLDARMRPVPLGLTGEIYIGGEIGSGYWNRPVLTSEKFVNNVVPGAPGRLYRTGDLARLDANGDFEFIGRIDQQVKIRGYRIELSEVQIAVASHPDVRQAFVMVREYQPGDRRLVAYVTLKREQPQAADAVREYARTKLPHYMVPSAVIPVAAIPLTTNGKIDRAALSALRESTEAPGALLEDSTALQRIVANIWKDLLNVKHVGLEDNFFDLGGDSLLGMRLSVALRDTFAVDMPLRHLFNSGSLREFCALLDSGERHSGGLENIARALEEIDRMPDDELPGEIEETPRERCLTA